MPKLSHHTSIVFGQSLLMAQTVRIMYLVLPTFMFEGLWYARVKTGEGET